MKISIFFKSFSLLKLTSKLDKPYKFCLNLFKSILYFSEIHSNEISLSTSHWTTLGSILLFFYFWLTWEAACFSFTVKTFYSTEHYYTEFLLGLELLFYILPKFYSIWFIAYLNEPKKVENGWIVREKKIKEAKNIFLLSLHLFGRCCNKSKCFLLIWR